MTRTETTNLKFCLLNAENLFLMFDGEPLADIIHLPESEWQRMSSSVYENKPLKKCHELAKALQEINADIVMLCEVGGLESLKNFNRLFLSESYSPVLIEGNSDRNIDVGFLIKKNQLWHFDLASNRNRLINYLYPHERQSLDNDYLVKSGKITSSHKFSRDAVELRLFFKERENPFLCVILTHLKSRLDPERIDPNGFERRQAELKTLMSIYDELEKRHPSTPIMVAGDFNGNASNLNTDEEFKLIYTDTGLKDTLEVAGVNNENRATFYQVRNNHKSDGKQIDFAFLSPLLQTHLKKDSAYVYRYKNEVGREGEAPKTMDEKLRLPSDHYPLVFEFENLERK